MEAALRVGADLPVPLVCPTCHGSLRFQNETLICGKCAGEYPLQDGFLNLIVGPRFDDALPESEVPFEEACGIETTRNYWLPLFRATWPGQAPVVLSVGCGVGSEIAELVLNGIDSVGVDCGNRVRAWIRRRYPTRLLLANGLRLPFPGQSFDGVFCGCVFPHVGVKGDSFDVESDYLQQRLQLALEIARVLKPGGKLFAASPNRRFPLDLFHRQQAGTLRPRWNSPQDPFLLSLADYGAMFQKAGYDTVASLPPSGYWHFNRTRRTWKGRVLAIPVRFLFRLNGLSAHSAVRASALAPWLVVQATLPT